MGALQVSRRVYSNGAPLFFLVTRHSGFLHPDAILEPVEVIALKANESIRQRRESSDEVLSSSFFSPSSSAGISVNTVY